MRLQLRRQTDRSDGAARLPRDGDITREAPPGALVRWLRQGLRSGICPLCRVAHKADREYIWHFYDEGSNNADALEGVRRSLGFCAEHIEMLRQIDVDDMKTTLSISVLFADTFAGIIEQLDALGPDAGFTPAPCPACTSRDEYLRRNAEYLLDMLATSPGFRDKFEASPGLCFPHFKLAWNVARTRGDREMILSVQRDAASSLLDELRDHVRKHDHKYRHEPKGPERDSWQRAILLTAGWPPPAESAGKPEQR
jgi:hypothetical protein